MRSLQLFIPILAVILLASCKVKVNVPDGGEVNTESAAFSCGAGEMCEIDVVDLFFDETFVAEPANGFVFKAWKKRHRGLCGGNKKPCRLFTSGFEGNEILMSFLENDEEFFLEPVFESVALSAQLQAKYDRSCATCHGRGTNGAPRTGNAADWEPRLARGMDALLRSVKNGRGLMPRGGNCSNCSDADYRALITYMSTPM
jgi:cytochrome c5